MAAFNSVTVPFQKGKDLCNTQGVKFKEASAEFRDRAKRGRRLPRLAIPLSAGRGFGEKAEVGVHRLAVAGAGHRDVPEERSGQRVVRECEGGLPLGHRGDGNGRDNTRGARLRIPLHPGDLAGEKQAWTSPALLPGMKMAAPA